MSTRRQIVRRIGDLVGPTFRIIDERNGWPALAEVNTSLGIVPVAVFVAPVGLGGRDYDDAERRIQNPGQNRPIVIPPSTIPLVLGLWEADDFATIKHPVLMAADAWKREGLVTRHSVFVRLVSLLAAAQQGRDERENTRGETIVCFHPSRLHEYVEALLVEAVERPGVQRLAAPPDTLAGESPNERRRRAAHQLARDTRFGARVIAYYGERCALCDLDLGLVQGAHIYPVVAADSPDEPWNGISLCANHHVAFDRHYIFIHPRSREVRLHPWLVERAAADTRSLPFVQGTLSNLREPLDPAARPIDDMFARRYEYFGSSYDWSGGGVPNGDAA